MPCGAGSVTLEAGSCVRTVPARSAFAKVVRVSGSEFVALRGRSRVRLHFEHRYCKCSVDVKCRDHEPFQSASFITVANRWIDGAS